MTTLEIVEQGTILRATVGSTVHGLHHGGHDDRGEMAVFIEPPEYFSACGWRECRACAARTAAPPASSASAASCPAAGRGAGAPVEGGSWYLQFS